ncbi:MAG: hypothetical protein J7L55_02300 [Desulfurococcales archaeon]|nr:hypothetical protein [Desulfurococcales archaeon]
MGIKSRGIKWSSLAFVLMLIAVDAYTSVVKSSTLYIFLIEKMRSEFYATSLISLQGIIALSAPFLGLISDRVRSSCRRILCPIIGLVLLLSGYLTFGLLVAGKPTSIQNIIGLPAAMIFIYLSIILVELSALSVIVDEFPPYQRTPVVSMMTFTYLATASVSFIANAYTLPVEALTAKHFLTPSIVSAVLIIAAVVARASTRSKGERYRGVSHVSEIVRGLSKFKGLNELYLSLFLAYVYFAAIVTGITPAIYESLHGVTITSGHLIPTHIKFLAYATQIFFNVGGMAGALSFNFLAKLIDYRKIPLGGLTLFATSFILGLILKSPTAGLILATAAGFGWGAYIVFTVLYPAMVASKENPGVVYGLLILSYNLAYAVGPYIMFSLVTLTGTYLISYLLMLAILAASVWVTARILK